MSGLLPGLVTPLAAPASWLYGVAVGARNRRFDRGERVAAIGVPVVSVGNITVGGSGKTPMVGWVADILLARGNRPVIAMRGYRARPGEPADETMEHRARRPDVPVVADPDRAGGLASFLPGRPETDCVILDDGFQHRRLKRDLDIVLIDATAGTMDDHLLPWGRLREPLENLRRADAVVVTRATAVDERLADRIEHHHGRAPVAWSRHAWGHLEVHEAGRDPERADVGWLQDRRVTTLAGIGNRRSFLEQVERAGARIVADLPARDHEQYARSKLARLKSLSRGVDAVVTTTKDWVKVEKDLRDWPVPIVVPSLEIDVFDGAEALENLIVRVLPGADAPRGSAHAQAY